MESEQAWLDGLRGGASQAAAVAELRALVRRTLAKGFGRQLQDADVEDLTQECMLRVQQKLATFAGQCKFTTWATTIAINAAVSTLRRRRYEHVSIDQAAERVDWSRDPSGATEDAVEDEARIALLRRGIAEALTERQREAVNAALGGLPLTELARRYEGVRARCTSCSTTRVGDSSNSSANRRRVMSNDQSPPKAAAALRYLLGQTRDDELDCDRFLELLPPYLDGRVTAAALREQIEHHSRTCPECAEELELIRRAISPGA